MSDWLPVGAWLPPKGQVRRENARKRALCLVVREDKKKYKEEMHKSETKRPL